MAVARSVMALPTGVVTFLFTDIEGSTRLAHELDEAWPGLLQEHHRLLRAVFPEHGGVEVSTAGDSFFLAFASAADAVEGAVAMQRAIAAHNWSPRPRLRVRMGLHTGDAVQHDQDYAGLTVHAASRVESAAAGGQVLMTEATLVAVLAERPGCVDVLDLGMHRLKDLPAEVHIFQVVADGLRRDFPPIRGVAALRNNVPAPASSFVGRADALAALHQLLEDNRLVTLLGPGGAGKTRLSLKLASERLNRYADGIWFVELDPARDEPGVVHAVADAIGLREEPGTSLRDTLLDALRTQTVLFVIDNCEHVIDAAARVVNDILRAGPGVRVIATTREPLDVDGECIWPVPPLSLGGPPETSEAVQLLVERIGSVQPEFQLDDKSELIAVEVARALDGLPLALELAAANAAILTLDEIRAQLQNRFAAFTRGKRTALDRQRTLQGAIDWSYDLLDEAHRAMFRQLAMFPSEFDHDAVLAVCDRIETASVAALVRKSLVVETPNGRHRLLESIRAYGRERLAEAGEAEALAERHARWFASSVLEPEAGPAWARDPDGLDTVHDDLVASVDWATTHDGELALNILAQLQQVWVRRARFTELRQITDRVLAATATIDSRSRAEVLHAASDVAIIQGDFPVARERMLEMAALSGRLGGESAEQIVLANLGSIAMREGDLQTAETSFARGLDLVEGNTAASAVVLVNLAEVARLREDIDLAWTRASAAADLAREAGDAALLIRCTIVLGSIAQQRGDHAAARTLYEVALADARGVQDDEPVTFLLFALATLALDGGDVAAAVPLLTQAVVAGRDADARADLAESLEATARVAAARGHLTSACRLLAAANALRDSIGFPRAPADVGAYDAILDDVRGRCDSATFDRAWASGAALLLEDAVAEALRVLK